jgi:short-subunit dehydrogenase
MPSLRALERKKAAFLTGASSGIGKAARQVAFARRPRALFDKILRSQFGLA